MDNAVVETGTPIYVVCYQEDGRAGESLGVFTNRDDAVRAIIDVGAAMDRKLPYRWKDTSIPDLYYTITTHNVNEVWSGPTTDQ